MCVQCIMCLEVNHHTPACVSCSFGLQQALPYLHGQDLIFFFIEYYSYTTVTSQKLSDAARTVSLRKRQSCAFDVWRGWTRGAPPSHRPCNTACYSILLCVVLHVSRSAEHPRPGIPFWSFVCVWKGRWAASQSLYIFSLLIYSIFIYLFILFLVYRSPFWVEPPAGVLPLHCVQSNWSTLVVVQSSACWDGISSNCVSSCNVSELLLLCRASSFFIIFIDEPPWFSCCECLCIKSCGVYAVQCSSSFSSVSLLNSAALIAQLLWLLVQSCPGRHKA